MNLYIYKHNEKMHTDGEQSGKSIHSLPQNRIYLHPNTVHSFASY